MIVRRAIGVLALALLAVGTAGCGSARRSSLPAPTIVPWLDLPLPLYHVPPPRTVAYPTSAPPCRASQLRATQGRSGGAGGTWYQRVVFTNVGTTTCLLRGYPTISAVEPNGVRRVLRSRTHDAGVDDLVPADIAPGRHALLDLASADRCYPATHLRQPVFAFQRVGSISAGDRFGLLAFCGISWSTVGLSRREVVPRAAPGTGGELNVTVQVPSAVRAGATLAYTVTLRNPTGRALSLSPCPGYTQGLYAAGLVVRGSFELDCAAARSIAPLRHVRFAMRIVVPRRAKPGFAKLSWGLDTPTGRSSGAGVRIVSAGTS